MRKGLQLQIRRDGKNEKKQYPKRDQFAAEISYFAECILKNRKPEPSGDEGMADIRIVEAIYKAIQTNKPSGCRLLKRAGGPICARRSGKGPTASLMLFTHSRHPENECGYRNKNASGNTGQASSAPSSLIPMCSEVCH